MKYSKSNHTLFHVCEDRVFLLRAGNHRLKRDQQVLLVYRLTAMADGPFIETALARYVMQIAELTRVNQYASMLVGKTQWGKTWALKEYFMECFLFLPVRLMPFLLFCSVLHFMCRAITRG